MIKVVAHCMGDLATGGIIKFDLEKKFGEKIEYIGFAGQLAGQNLKTFLEECKNADVVITDAWNHPENSDNWTVKQTQEDMFRVLERVQKVNPEAALFAQLMEGIDRVAAHRIAEPHQSYHDDVIISRMEEIRALKDRKHVNDLVIVLIVDDNNGNLQAAREQLGKKWRLITTPSYLNAIEILSDHKVDIVLTDLMMPCEAENQGAESKAKFVGQEAPMGVFVALKAAEMGVEGIVVISDTGHHDHPAGHVAEKMGSFDPIHWLCGSQCPKVDGGYKNWMQALRAVL